MTSPKRKPQIHKQVPARVIAYVDEGIKELVEILNTFDKLSTFESCQGRNEKGRGAFVYADYGKGSPYTDSELAEMALFVNQLAKAFDRYNSGQDKYMTNISIEWWGDMKVPFISIEMPSSYVGAVTRSFSLLRNQFESDKKNK